MPKRPVANDAASVWEGAPKPWDVSVCEARYVYGDRISLTKLAALAGITDERKVKRWSSHCKWVDKRKAYMDRLAKFTQDKILEAESDKLSSEYLKRNEKHLRAYELVTRTTVEYFLAIAKGQVHTKKDFDSNAYHRMVNALDTAVGGERTATGMRYFQDINHALAKVLSENYVPINPEDANISQLGEEE